MKSSFSILIGLIASFCLEAREIISINYQASNMAQMDKALLVKNILVKKLDIPKAFINIQASVNPCFPRPDLIAQLCFDSNNEIIFPVFKEKIIKKTLGQFVTYNQSQEHE